MQTIPDSWTAARSGLYRMETKVSINGIEYSEEDLVSVSTSSSLFSSATPSIGCCVAKEIDLSFVPKASIPRMAEIKVFTRPIRGGLEPEWLQKGVFYIDTRETNEITGVMTIHGYDAMLKTEQPYCPDGSGTWPRSMATVVNDICGRIGVTLDSRTVISSEYVCQLDTTLTQRQYLSYIAVAHGGNWTITDAGALRLVPFVASAPVADVGKQVQQLDTSPAFEPITKVILWCTDEDAFIAGDDTGRTIEADFPWATQKIADAVHAALKGFVYQPYTATHGRLNSEVELGDAVAVNGLTGQVADVRTTFNSMCLSDFSAPADEEVDHEYHYTTSEKRMARRISKMTSELRVMADSIEGVVEDMEENRSEFQQTAEGFEQRISNAEGDIAEITQTTAGFSQRISNAEGDIAEISQTTDGFNQRISNAEGDIVEINTSLEGVAYKSSLAAGTTVINGGCITTGTIDASKATISNLTVTNANIVSLDADKITVAGKSLGGSSSYLSAIYAAYGSITELSSHVLTLNFNSPDEGVPVEITGAGVKVGSNALVSWSDIIAGGQNATAVFG